MSSSASEPLPRRLGEYEVLLELASGGMAKVLLARQTGDAGFERLVALKRVHRHLLAEGDVFEMAADEARLAGLIRHASVVPVIGVIDTQGELVLVQEYVEGASLAALLRRGGPLAPALAARVAIDALRGLHAAHEAKDLRGEGLGIVHRDVSPQNLLVGSDGTTRVIDFGIARAEHRMALTKTGVVKGKVQYMAPEQLEEQPIDRRADVFAAGAVLFELLSGKRPFGDAEDAVVMKRLLLGQVDLGAVEAAAPALAPVVAAALAQRPEDRPATAAELAKRVAEAVAPAEPEAVAALVEARCGAELALLRERIRAALGSSLDDEAPPSDEAPAIGEPAAPAASAARPSSPRDAAAEPASDQTRDVTTGSVRPAPRRVGLGGFGLLVVPAAALAFFALRGPGPGGRAASGSAAASAGAPAAPASEAASVTAAASAAPTGAPDAPAPNATETAKSDAPSATASAPTASGPTSAPASGSARPKVSATPSASASSELLPSPYPKKP